MNEAEWAKGVSDLIRKHIDDAVSKFIDQSKVDHHNLQNLHARVMSLEEQLKAIPAGPPGPQGERGERGEKGDPGERGERGEKGDPGERGETGERGFDGAPGQKGDAGPQGERGEAGPAGDRGPVGPTGERGMDGLAGRDGRDGLSGAPGSPGDKGLDGVNGKDGKDGIDGKDGFALEDFSLDFDGHRTLTFRFEDHQRRKEFPIAAPWPVDDGAWKRGETYKKGAGVSYGGSWFIAQRDTDAVPETPDCGWRLAVKRGRDGKDGKNGEKGEKGDPGPRGHDLTQRDFDGKTRW